MYVCYTCSSELCVCVIVVSYVCVCVIDNIIMIHVLYVHTIIVFVANFNTL